VHLSTQQAASIQAQLIFTVPPAKSAPKHSAGCKHSSTNNITSDTQQRPHLEADNFSARQEMSWQCVAAYTKICTSNLNNRKH